jgi:hypothetical protein
MAPSLRSKPMASIYTLVDSCSSAARLDGLPAPAAAQSLPLVLWGTFT